MALGPVVIALPRLFLLLGLAAALLTAHLLESRGGPSLERPLWWSLLGGLLAARLVYVLTHLPDFQAQPWQALFIWQDGYVPLAGVAAAVVVAAWFAYRRSYRPQRLFAPLLIALAVWGGLSFVHDALRRATDMPLPDLAVEDLQGVPITLESFRGQPVVLNLWASWCAPCRREMPTLAAAQQSHPTVHFLFVNQAEGPATVRQYLSIERLQLRNVLLDLHGRVGDHFSAPGLPTTLFFNTDGKLVHTHLGELSNARLGDYLRALERRQ